MRKQLIGVMFAAAAAGLAVSAPAWAQSRASTSMTVNLYAGPASDYPIVAQIPGGAPVTVMGCVAGYSWCDISVPGVRGWVYGGYLNYPYQGTAVPLLKYGAMIGLSIVAFSLATYWNNYYRDRPWYNNQSRWMRHSPPPRRGPPPRPPGYGAKPPHLGGPGHGGVRPPGAKPGPGAGGRPPHAGRPPGAGASPGGRPHGGGQPPRGGARGGPSRPSGGN